MQKVVRHNRSRFNTSFCLWEAKFTTRYEVDKMAITFSVNRYFKNFLCCCYNNGFSQQGYLDKLRKEHGIKLSRHRVMELAGLGRYAGVAYKGYLSFEWLFAISVFCKQEFSTMMTTDFTTEPNVKYSVTRYWAGKGKGVRAGAIDLTRNSFPEALNYTVKRK